MNLRFAIHRALHKPAWKLLRAVSPRCDIDGLSLVFVWDTRMDAIVRSVSRARDIIYASDYSYWLKITDALSFVGVFRGELISLPLRAYILSFTRYEIDNPFYLSCRLIWVATYLDLSLGAHPSGRFMAEEEIGNECRRRQKAFVATFSDPEEWFAWLDREQARSNIRILI